MSSVLWFESVFKRERNFPYVQVKWLYVQQIE